MSLLRALRLQSPCLTSKFHTSCRVLCQNWPAPDAVKDPAVKKVVELPTLSHEIPQTHNEVGDCLYLSN